jgi:hypothetical protein
MGNVVLPLWQLAPPRDGGYPRTKALPNLQTFEEFYASVHPDKKLADQLPYRAMRALDDPLLKMFRVAVMPPKTPDDAAATIRSAFTAMWKDPKFLADYSRVVNSEPILVTAQEGEAILAGLASVPSDVKEFLAKYIANMTSK